MPYGNRMGPDGMGAGTGRRLGYCAGYDRPGCYNNSGFARGGAGTGRGFARGGGRGNGVGFVRGAGQHPFYPAGVMGGFSPDFRAGNSNNEMEFLKEQADNLENELAAVNARIKIVEESVKEKE